jgi:hypothetical protein
MTPAIQRIRYYDGEYLRAFDFAAEQGYHVDMRRRLNMALHLNGVGVGLQLVPSAPGAVVSQVYINPGMGIDEYGREIYLTAPYTFDDQADVLASRISSKGYYYVWLKYQRIADTPPSAGYAVCNASGQTTRWRESYKVVLQQTSTPTQPPSSASTPAVTDDISEEDPDTDTSSGVFLGVVLVDPSSNTGAFSLPGTQPPLTYVGLRAQRIVSPATVDPASFQILNQQNALVPAASLELDDNVFAKQNLIVGDDFAVTVTPPPTPQPSGNVKITGDLYLNGKLYTNDAGQGQSLQDLIQNSLPDVQVYQPQTISTSTTGANAIAGTVPFPVAVKTNLKTVSKISVLAVLCGFELQDPADLTKWFNNPATATDTGPVAVWADQPTVSNPPAASYQIQINWKAGWLASFNPGPTLLLGFKSLTVGLVVVFLP